MTSTIMMILVDNLFLDPIRYPLPQKESNSVKPVKDNSTVKDYAFQAKRRMEKRSEKTFLKRLFYFISSQKQTAAAAATFNESTP